MVHGLPSLSQVEATTVDHLTGVAEELDLEADLVERTFTDVHKKMGVVAWTGQAYDAACTRIDSDRVIAVGAAACRREAASVARAGAERLLLARAAALRSVAKARHAGFEVRDDLLLSAYVPGRPLQEAMRLQPLANELSEEIRSHVA